MLQQPLIYPAPCSHSHYYFLFSCRHYCLFVPMLTMWECKWTCDSFSQHVGQILIWVAVYNCGKKPSDLVPTDVLMPSCLHVEKVLQSGCWYNLDINNYITDNTIGQTFICTGYCFCAVILIMSWPFSRFEINLMTMHVSSHTGLWRHTAHTDHLHYLRTVNVYLTQIIGIKMISWHRLKAWSQMAAYCRSCSTNPLEMLTVCCNLVKLISMGIILIFMA